MLRARVMLTVVLLVFSLNACAQSVSQLEKRVQDISRLTERATVAIGSYQVVNMKDGSHSPMFIVMGSGFLINDRGYFITADHVVKAEGDKHIGRMEVALHTRGLMPSPLPFRIVGESVRRDVALCRIRGFEEANQLGKTPSGPSPRRSRYAGLRLAKTPIRLGQFVIISGYPRRTNVPMVQFGNIASLHMFDLFIGLAPKRFVVSVAVSPGSSGSPVVSLDSGRVVGVVVGGLFPTWAQRVGLAVADPVGWIQALLDEDHVHSR